MIRSTLKIGDKKIFERVVREEDSATFESGPVHPVYATFALTRDAEWASRVFVLELKDPGEEGIGIFVQVNHISPAFIGDTVIFETTLDQLKNNEVNCSFTAKVNGRLIAQGRTGQKIVPVEKIEAIFRNLKK